MGNEKIIIRQYVERMLDLWEDNDDLAKFASTVSVLHNSGYEKEFIHKVMEEFKESIETSYMCYGGN